MLTRRNEKRTRAKPEGAERITPPHERAAQAVRTLTRLTAVLGALAIGAVVFALATFASAQARLSSVDAETAPVCTAVRAIKAGTVIEANMLTLQDVPASLAAEGAIGTREEAVGKLAVEPIPANGQITAGALASSEPAASLAGALDAGSRAISVAVDAETGLAGLIRHGDRVDVLSEGRAIVENAKVIAVDSSLSETLEEYATVTVQVSPEDAIAIQAAQELAPVRLSMRSAVDALTEEASGETTITEAGNDSAEASVLATTRNDRGLTTTAESGKGVL
ncbi:MAG TPA: Flp pilus assembly protein CpaB [Candidatus Aveggerthella excrementigallinarum]|nr:Flp pilus assembly protein CpaB [Candidatus Aveggerthella excrementigallinarum]